MAEFINASGLKRALQVLTTQPDVSLSELIKVVNNAAPTKEQQIRIVGPNDMSKPARQVFKLFTSDRIVQSSKQAVTAGLWSNGLGTLNTFFLNGTQTGSVSGYYYYDVYQSNPTTSPDSAEVQFSLAYGHVSGGGSPSLSSSDTSTQSTKAIYSQIRNIISDDTTKRISFETVATDDIYVLSVARGRMKEKVDPGNWELRLSGPSGLVKLVDDSDSVSTKQGKAGRVFRVVSGSLNTGTGTGTTYQSGSATYGYFYPDTGLFVFHPAALATSLGATLTPDTASNGYKYNQQKLFTAISVGSEFQARNIEEISSTYYYINAGNTEFNFSNNPTYFNANTGELAKESFFGDPKVYITTIGLYNSENDLLAVAKLSKPVQKHFGNEVNIQVRLDF